LLNQPAVQGLLFGFCYTTSLAGVGGIAGYVGMAAGNKPPALAWLAAAVVMAMVGPLAYLSQRAIRKALPLTIFRFGNEYEGVVAYRSMLIKCFTGIVAAIGLVSAILTLAPIFR
jgi:hypothetical protein